MSFPQLWQALAGGALLGLSAAILMLFSGKVAGISGAIGGLFNQQKHEALWRLSLLVGMVSSAFVLQKLGFTLPDVSNKSMLMVCAAGLLVGFGTRLANGCTSGHGIIGMARLSKRSMVATALFMATAMLVVACKSMWGVQ